MSYKSHEIFREICNKLALSPRLKDAAKGVGMSAPTLFTWLQKSRGGDESFKFEWLGREAFLHQHVEVARKLSLVSMDHSSRDLAINGHSTPKFLNGAPVWKVDPVIAAEALSLDDNDWFMLHGKRDRSDVFARDPKTGALIQEMDIHPPNPQLLVKMLSSLMPDVYGDKSEINVRHSGHVWIDGEAPKQIDAKVGEDYNETFALTQKPNTINRPQNILAIPAPCKTAEEFDHKFRRKAVREVVIFRDVEGKPLAPLADDVVVEGSWQDKTLTEGGIEHETVTAQSLLDQGYQNDFLFELAPAQAINTAEDDRMVFADTDTPIQRDIKEHYWRTKEQPPQAPVPITIFAPEAEDMAPGDPKARAAADDARVRNYIDEAVSVYRDKRVMTPQQRQVAQAVERGESAEQLKIRVLAIIAPRRDSDSDNIGLGEVRGGGFKVA
jgi:hypothetical protein